MSTANAPSDDWCSHCNAVCNSRENRIIIDNCGHRKCRRCLLVDEECIECIQVQQAARHALPAETQEVQAAREQIAATTKDRKKRDTVAIPAHIQRVQTILGAIGYHCSKCNKSFTSRSQQYYHLYCDSIGDKKYKCGQCHRSFSTHSHLKYHLESHAKRTYHCTGCNQTFSNKVVLRKHERLHQRKVAFECSECMKVFRCQQAFNAHIKQHRSDYEVPFKCTICDKGYALKSTLQQHMLKHAEKKHKCPQCDKCFQRNSTLKLHLKRHSKTDSFICTTCFKKFSDASVLLRHARLHEETTKFRCIDCDVITARRDNMLRHVRNMHPTESFQSCVDILKPTITTDSSTHAPNMPVQVDVRHIARELSENLPKTVENSSVIKCIGNVEPVKVPSELIETHTEPVSAIVTHKEDNASTLTNLETVNLNVSCTATVAMVQKKVKKKYDPIEMYRKILTSDCEDLSDGENELEQKEQRDVVEPTNTTEKRTTFNTSNFSEMHWRKNFKYTYEYQDY